MRVTRLRLAIAGLLVLILAGFVFLRGPTPHIEIKPETLYSVWMINITNTMVTSWLVVALMVALVDHPFIKPKTCRLLIETSRKNPGRIIIPTHDSRRGHPIIIPGEIIEQVKKSPVNANLRQIIGKYQRLVVELPVNDAGILKDIDTISDLKGATKT